MLRFDVVFYESAGGEQPAKAFLLTLDKKMRAKMVSMISLLQNNGYELREPYSKYLSEGIFELRAKVGSDVTRVLYFFYVDRQIVLTNGFVKKTKKHRRRRLSGRKNTERIFCTERRAGNECEI